MAKRSIHIIILIFPILLFLLPCNQLQILYNGILVNSMEPYVLYVIIWGLEVSKIPYNQLEDQNSHSGILIFLS